MGLVRQPPDPPHPHVARAEKLARWMDDRFLDPLIGLVLPGVGDLASAGVGLYIVAVAVQIGLPAIVIARMLLNLGLDALVGVVPLLGDAFDLVFKANRKNVALLKARHTGGSTARDWLVVAGAAGLLVAALALPIVVIRWAFTHSLHW
jgi:hypothetical protein